MTRAARPGEEIGHLRRLTTPTAYACPIPPGWMLQDHHPALHTARQAGHQEARRFRRHHCGFRGPWECEEAGEWSPTELSAALTQDGCTIAYQYDELRVEWRKVAAYSKMVTLPDHGRLKRAAHLSTILTSNRVEDRQRERIMKRKDLTASSRTTQPNDKCKNAPELGKGGPRSGYLRLVER